MGDDGGIGEGCGNMWWLVAAGGGWRVAMGGNGVKWQVDVGMGVAVVVWGAAGLEESGFGRVADEPSTHRP